MDEIIQKEISLKLKAQELLKAYGKLEPSQEVGRKMFYLKNFICHFYGRTIATSENNNDEIETNFVYVDFHNILSKL